MPRCGAEGLVTRTTNSVTQDINVVTAGNNVQVQGAIIFRVLRGEWHPIETSTGKVVMETETDLPYSQMDLVVQWPPTATGNNLTPSLYRPNAPGVAPEALDGLATLFGIDPGMVGVYTSSTPDASSPQIRAAWMAYSCLLGDEDADGKELTEVIMTEKDGTKIRGGWVFAEPSSGPSSGGLPGPSQGNGEKGTWMTLSTNRFAIIGGELGALFGPGRKLYFESGVDETLRSSIRQEFGFGANDGEDAYIQVMNFVHDFLLVVTPE